MHAGCGFVLRDYLVLFVGRGGGALEGVWTVVSVLWRDEGMEEGQGVTQ